MKRLLVLFFCLVLLFLILSAGWYYSKFRIPSPKTSPQREDFNRVFNAKIQDHAKLLFAYANAKGFNNQLAFLVDMSIESGKNRFFVYDLRADSVIKSGLVAHGNCNERWLNGRKYGNEPGCGCTSLGKYKIGNPYDGRFGRAYKLFGLDSANSNAYRRFVVLHSFYAVPEQEVFPYPICQSEGCPMVSEGFLRQLQLIIDNSEKPILLWIYD